MTIASDTPFKERNRLDGSDKASAATVEGIAAAVGATPVPLPAFKDRLREDGSDAMTETTALAILAASGGGIAPEDIVTAEFVVMGHKRYEPDGAAGTFNEATRNTDPGEANVLTGTSYKIANITKQGLTRAGISTIHSAGTGSYETSGTLAGKVADAVAEVIDATSLLLIDRTGSGITGGAITNGGGVSIFIFNDCNALASFSLDSAASVADARIHGVLPTADIDALLLRFYTDALANIASANLTQTPAAPPTPSVPVLTGSPTGWDPITGVVWSFDGLGGVGGNAHPSWVGKVSGVSTYAKYRDPGAGLWIVALYAEKNTTFLSLVGGCFSLFSLTPTGDYTPDGSICGGTLSVAVNENPYDGEAIKALLAGGPGTGWTSVITD